jgi:hypothetical protein
MMCWRPRTEPASSPPVAACPIQFHFSVYGISSYGKVLRLIKTQTDAMNLPGKRVRRTRLVRTDRFNVAVAVEAGIPDADPSEACFEPQAVELLREVELRAKRGDVDWLKQHGKVYAAMGAS